MKPHLEDDGSAQTSVDSAIVGEMCDVNAEAQRRNNEQDDSGDPAGGDEFKLLLYTGSKMRNYGNLHGPPSSFPAIPNFSFLVKYHRQSRWPVKPWTAQSGCKPVATLKGGNL